MKKIRTMCFFVCAIVVMSSTVAEAVLIASDSFAVSAGGNDYIPFTGIEGQNPTVGAAGFDSGWNTAFTSAFQAFPGGMTHSLTPGASMDGHLKSGTFDGTVAPRTRNLSRSMDYTPSGGTYYMSFLLHKFDATTRDDLLVGLSPLQDSEESIFTVQGAYLGFVDGGISFLTGPGPDLTTVLSSSQMHVDETYFALMQIDYSTTDTDSVMVTIYDGSAAEVANPTFSNLNLDNSMGRFGVLTQDFGTRPGFDEFRFGTQLADVMVQPAPCDLDGDGDCDEMDLRVLYDDIAAGNASNADIDTWLTLAGTENTDEYRAGDTDLDGDVDGADFSQLAASFGGESLPGAYWNQGNFDGVDPDGVFRVGGSDFSGLAANFGYVSVSTVPEPTAGVWLVLSMLVLLVSRRCRG